MSVLLDTHVWLWAQLAPERLSARAADVFAGDGQLCLSPMTFYEVLVLAERGRIALTERAPDWIRISLARRPLRVLDVTAEIALGARSLDGFANPDPFDRFILATARAHAMPIVTRDRSMTDWGRVPIIW